MRTIFTLLSALSILLAYTTAYAETPTKRSRVTLVAGVPWLDADLGIVGGGASFGFFGLGLNYRSSNGLYAGIYGTGLFNAVDELGKSIDFNLGYSFTVNEHDDPSWLFDIVPQIGYRYAERWLYHRDGFGPRNVSYGILMGLSYDLYQNKDAGFFLRAHSFFEWSPYSVFEPAEDRTAIGQNEVLRFGLDLGISVGFSFGCSTKDNEDC